eukprot:GFUD01042865.1.p1 GENE.GFUD01042865.1~~GFUD01042865.1.p1  ORF type:complete len:642 (+),score=216.87 GFUD01042865.1:140-2065(+)
MMFKLFSQLKYPIKNCYRLPIRALSDSITVKDIDLANFPPEKIRNFSIVAHIDHGKSTLADRILEMVGAIDTTATNKQVLDSLQVEKERGITVKAQSASVLYNYLGEDYILNMIDTPGHVDFSYEVTRSLRACQGVVLLVDANQGVQAQTVSNFYLAFANDLEILAVINKIDLPGADPEGVKLQLRSLFDVEQDQVLAISAKMGIGVKELLDRVVEKVPPPSTLGREGNLRLFLFDSWFDRYQGTINLVQVVDGVLTTKNTAVVSSKTGKEYKVKEVGLLTPSPHPCPALYPGQVGYLISSMKTASEAVIGDTFFAKDRPVDPLLSIEPAKPMVYAGVYPFNPGELKELKVALEKLCLNDNSVSISMETSIALGQGWRLGFLGVLHMEVFTQRLEQEFNAQVVVTAPSVPYKIRMKDEGTKKRTGQELLVANPSEWVGRMDAAEYQEPMVLGTIIAPTEYLSSILELCHDRRGEQRSIENIDQSRLNIQFLFPLNEVVTNFFDELKSVTSGYASFDYEDAGYQSSDLQKLDVQLNGMVINELSTICHASKLRLRAKAVVFKMRNELPRQQFNIAIQATVGGKIMAREDIKALRKDVTAKCYGGDISRKMKLLKNQAEGKKRMKKFGNIEIAKETFIKILTK